MCNTSTPEPPPSALLLLLLGLLGLSACGPPRRPPRHAHHGSPVNSLQLDLGGPGHPRGLVLLRPGESYDTARGARLSRGELAQRLASARVIFVGESHDDSAHHRVQAALIRMLARPKARTPAPRPRGAGASLAAGPLLVGMEMFFRGHAPAVLQRWARGELDEASFVKAVGWRHQWGMSFAYYRPVFGAARDHRITIVGLNVPLPLARKVGRQGLRALTPAELASLPRLHLAFARHRQVFRALLGLPPSGRALPHPGSGAQRPATPGHGAGAGTAPRSGHGGLLGRLFEAQVLRDEVMASEIVRALDRAGPGSRMVVLVGNGHLLYHTGVNDRLRRLRPSWPQATVICLSAGRAGIRVSRGLGDYLVATRARRRPAVHPNPRRRMIQRARPSSPRTSPAVR